ncbi:hypothetical protein A3K01_00205 [candidate division WWE3 bacterium RIFOXYD1_FULL_43_17]|uniref:SHOCT domain-containing protein n=3 Tax=Katanobacteria TaxID=422282 RepID=A0A1F4XCD5_UNCKA|nr:MAG: hypothetical protein UU59_C0005G0026 [candidate division WWE3 bacterium GW2011_GWE1_41_27]KKS60693.1 MAG: hypothetical protein UV26_C0002G0019 [candidate division WWE3 bacterium GW2011_GWF2_42_42]OGC79211.1 MAG: hypothetical protein A3K01_00205 [candidate division WWE3 bacterium RIFOXYD1_FULL_43_17]
MSILLLKLRGNPTLNRTIWPPELYIYDDLLTYRKRKWFVVREVTISYNQIAQATLHHSLLFAHLEIVTTGTDDLIVKYMGKKTGVRAKKILDQKLYHAHSKLHQEGEVDHSKMNVYEKGLNRYRELLNRGKITKKEYEKKKRDLLKRVE